MKFGNEFASQMVPEWQDAYMDYNDLKKLLKEILILRQGYEPKPVALTQKASLKRRVSLYRAFSGLTNRYNSSSPRGSPNKNDEEVILVNAVEAEDSSDGYYQTMFLMSEEEGGDRELLFFRKLDQEFNKVVKFYKEKVQEMKMEAEELNKQMYSLIALRIRVATPLEELKSAHVENLVPEKQGRKHMDAIQEVELGNDRVSADVSGGDEVNNPPQREGDKKKGVGKGSKPPPLEVLSHVKIKVENETPLSTLKNILMHSKDSSFSKEELRKAEEQMKRAFIEFYQNLRLLKNYSFLNQLAFSKIMKKYDKITSRNASKSYLKMVDNSYLGSSDEVSKLIEKVEATFVKYFSNGNRRKGMVCLRPQSKRERHRVTFFVGLFTGCSIALVVAIIVSIHARDLLKSEGRDQYMENIFPLYSLFGFIVLHLLVFAGDVYFWRRFRVNYPFIFGFDQGIELNYREVLLLASGLSVLALAGALSNLDMDMDPETSSFSSLTELVPLGLVIAVISITFCPFNIIYRSSRFFLIKCVWRCLCAPLYKVRLPDFFLADQLTSQVQAFRSLLFYACYYGWGNYEKRSNWCQDSDIYQSLYIIVAIIPFWSRVQQCVRRLFEEKDSSQGINCLRYLSTIIALVMRTCYDRYKGMSWKILASVSSGLTTIASTYWDVVRDWGLLRRNSKNPWLRDKLLVPNKGVYFAAIVINILLRLVWMQLVLDFNEAPFLHKKALVAVVACLEILRRGMWNFFRLENEHLNNVGKYRAFKSIPLPFNYDEDKGE